MTPSAAITVLEALRPRVGLDVSASEQYAAVNVAIEALREKDDWQPINTAPKDGRAVLLFWADRSVDWWGVAAWETFDDGSAGWIGQSFHSEPKGNWTSLLGESPTYWRSLPRCPDGTAMDAAIPRL